MSGYSCIGLDNPKSPVSVTAPNQNLPTVMFHDFKIAVSERLDQMTSSTEHLFVTSVSKDALWDTYLASFPEGADPIFRERTEHDCQCCKHFIRACGNAVAIVDSKIISVFDVEIDGFYQVVADALSALVKSQPIVDVFLHHERNLGTDFNFDGKDPNKVIKWHHFHYKLPEKFVNSRDRDSVLGRHRDNRQVLARSLQEITLDAAQTVLDLIDQNSLYRGQEHRAMVQMFIDLKKEYDGTDASARDAFLWATAAHIGQSSKIKNTVIGTLLSDLSSDTPLDVAVTAFEKKVAPENYKRPTALITQSMIKKAQETVADLGIEDSLRRRYAVADDITINNVLFADRSAKAKMGVFDELASAIKVDPDKLSKVEEVTINAFVATILPKVNKVEILVENRHQNNFMSLIAPVFGDAPNILKWDNNFSWAYSGEVTDSIKERVKRAGGNVHGVLRCSLSWFNFDDLDIHVIEPNGDKIFYRKKLSYLTGGCLDVDMNAGFGRTREPVENVVWTNRDRLCEGVYNVRVHNFTKREASYPGFTVEIECDEKIITLTHDKAVKDQRTINVAEITYSRRDGFKVKPLINSSDVSKDIWGIATQNYHPVTMIMQSPNHWDGQTTGNKHWFFILDQCKNPAPARGFFNEFLKPDLHEHRKVFEVLGSKMKTPESDNQLSGVGFSSTKRNSVFCRVSGNFSRVLKINF